MNISTDPMNSDNHPDNLSIDLPLLRLLQLVSPALPVGSFAYSQGLEWAVEAGWVQGPDSTAHWIQGQLSTTMKFVDIPLLVRMCDGWACGDEKRIVYWNEVLFACRETAELRLEEIHRGQALVSMLAGLEVKEAARWSAMPRFSFVAGYALAAWRWRIPCDSAIAGYLWSWMENQIIAAMKLVPLGQLAGQRLLIDLANQIPGVMSDGLACADEDIGAATPGLAIASCRHELQYTRLFHS